MEKEMLDLAASYRDLREKEEAYLLKYEVTGLGRDEFYEHLDRLSFEV